MTEPITSLPEAVADRGALPMPAGPARTPAELLAENALLQRKVASLKAEQDRCDAEYAEAIRERDRYQVAWKSARERAQAYGEGILRQVEKRDTWKGWCQEGQAEVERLKAELAGARTAALNEAAAWFDQRAATEPDQGYRARVMRGAANDIRRLVATSNRTEEAVS